MGRLIKESHQSAKFLEQSPRGLRGGGKNILLELVLSEGREVKVGERGAKGLPSMQKTRKLRKEAWRAILKVIRVQLFPHSKIHSIYVILSLYCGTASVS